MQKDIFLSFLLKLEENCQKILVGSDIDYRRLIPNKRMDQVSLNSFIAKSDGSTSLLLSL